MHFKVQIVIIFKSNIILQRNSPDTWLESFSLRTANAVEIFLQIPEFAQRYSIFHRRLFFTGAPGRLMLRVQSQRYEALELHRVRSHSVDHPRRCLTTVSRACRLQISRQFSRARREQSCWVTSLAVERRCRLELRGRPLRPPSLSAIVCSLPSPSLPTPALKCSVVGRRHNSPALQLGGRRRSLDEDSWSASCAAFQFVAGTSEVDELSDARLSIFIKTARWACHGHVEDIACYRALRSCYSLTLRDKRLCDLSLATFHVQTTQIGSTLLLLRVKSANFNKLETPVLEVGCAWQAVSWLHSDVV